MNLNDTNDLIDCERELYKSSLFHFAKYCLGYEQMTLKTHGRICRALEAQTKRKMVCVPRGTFKSSIVTIAYPMWLLEHNPNLRIMIDSEKFDNSKNFLREIKGHYENGRTFNEVFGNRVGPLWNESEIILSTRTRPKKEPSIVCSGIGAGKTSQHYDVIIADDLSSYKNCMTSDLSNKTIDHYKLYTSLLEPDGTIAIVGTRYSEADLIGFVIENELEIENQNIQRLKEIYCERR